MAFVTYEEIQPLIKHAEHRFNSMHVYFACPASGKVVEASGVIPRTMAHELKNEAAKGLLRHVLRQLQIFVRQATGVHLSLGSAAATGHHSENSIATEAGKQEAIVEAFEKVAVFPGKEPRIGHFHNTEGAWQLFDK